MEQRHRPPFVFSMAGSDPSGHAGLQLDLQVFAALNCRGGGLVTSYTLQHAGGVCGTAEVDPALIRSQLETLARDAPPKSIKSGMFGCASAVEAVLPFVARLRESGAVYILDPVFCSSSGYPLLDPPGRALLMERLLPLCSVATPNVDELYQGAALLAPEEFSGEERGDDSAMMERAACLWLTRAPAVLVKGGHMGRSAWRMDICYVRDSEAVSFGRPEIPGGERVRGTGCALSAALCCYLARGEALLPALHLAKGWLHGRIRALAR